MKNHTLTSLARNLVLAALLCLSLPVARAATIVWTNTAGGSFGIAANWSPNAVPGPSDVAVITNDGPYTVTLDTGRTLSGLQLGAASGVSTQTFTMNGNSLTLSAGGSSTINTSGVLIVPTTLTLLGANFTNHGTVTWVAGTISTGNGIGIYNHGLWDAQGNNQINQIGGPVATFYNPGTFRKSGGATTTTFNASVNFNNTGTLDVQIGTVNLAGGGASTGPGIFNTSSGATVSFGNSYTFNSGSLFTGAGTNLLAAGTFTLNGDISFTRLTQTGGTIAGTHVLNGVFDFLGGSWASSGASTIASNSTLTVAANLPVNPRSITNHGTVAWVTGTISTGDGIGIYNHGLWDAQGNQIQHVGGPVATFHNAGTFRKSGGPATTTINTAVNFNNSGTLDVQIGTVNLAGGGANTAPGTFNTSSGATVFFGNSYTFNSGSLFTGAGTNLLAAGTFTLNGEISFTRLTQTGGTIAGTHVLNGVFDFLGGSWASSGASTIASNSTLIVAANLPVNPRSITNHGTVAWVTGTISTGDGIGIYNHGLWDAQGNNQIQHVGGPVATFHNPGIFRKSGGPTTTTINTAVNFNNTGTLDVQIGTVNLVGGGANTAPGTFNTSGGATVSFGNSYTFTSGSLFTGAGTNLLAAGTFTLNGDISFTRLTQTGGTIAGTHVLHGSFDFLGGSWGTGGFSTIASNSTLTVAANLPVNPRSITNHGTVMWVSGTISTGEGIGIYNHGLWDAQGNQINHVGGIASTFHNAGTFRKSGGPATTTINTAVNFNNTGLLDVQTGTVSLVGTRNLAGGTINIGISSLTDFGKVALSGASAFAGSFSANLNGGYVPITNNSFPVISYGSLSGLFTNYSLPFADAWTTNYSPTTFSLNVLNARPIPPVVTNQIMSELTSLIVTNTAIDLDVPTNTLAYFLLAPPAGAAIDSNGIITWTPDEAQGPGTNLITTVVTDNGVPALSATNSFTVVVQEVNVAPALSSQANTNVNELTTLTLTNSATDSDFPANSLTYQLLDAPSGATIDTNGVITWTPTEAVGLGTNTFTTVVTDYNPDALNSQQLTVTNVFEVVVNEVNVTPVLILPADTNISELAAYSAQAAATDSDLPANALSFALVSGPSGLTVSPGGLINWTPTEDQAPSTNTVILQVSDLNPPAVNATSLSVTNSYTIIVQELNVAPVLPAQTNVTILELTALTLTNTATDADLPTNALTYFLLNPPAGAAIDTNGVITWTPTEAQGPGTNIITTVVTDLNAEAINTQSFSVTNSFEVVVQEGNAPPALILPPATNINELALFSALATATDSDLPTNTLTFALVSGPAGLTVAADGFITWTPTEEQGPSTNQIVISVTDTNPLAANSTSLSVTGSFQVIVREVNSGPTLGFDGIPYPDPEIPELQPYTFNLLAHDSDIPTNQLTYGVSGGPPGLTVSPSGLLSWTPDEAQGPGNYAFVVTVYDFNPDAVNAASFTNGFGVVIRVLESNSPPVLGVLTNRSVNPGQVIGFTATATDPDLPTNTLTFSLLSPPAGAAIGAGGEFTWRAPAVLAGTTNSIQVRVQDNGSPNLEDTKSFNVVVSPIAPVVLTALAYSNGGFYFNVAGPVGPDYVVLASTNLADWSSVATNTPAAVPFQLGDPTAGAFTNRVYRVRLEP